MQYGCTNTNCLSYHISHQTYECEREFSNVTIFFELALTSSHVVSSCVLADHIFIFLSELDFGMF